MSLLVAFLLFFSQLQPSETFTNIYQVQPVRETFVAPYQPAPVDIQEVFVPIY